MSNELMHYGVRGQKWGVRRYQNADGSLTKAGERRYGSIENYKKVQDAKAQAEARKKAAKANARTSAEVAKYNAKNQNSEKSKDSKEVKTKVTKKSVKAMSDQELNDGISRLQKEKQYKELVQGENVTRGRKAVSEALTESGKQATRTIATAAMTYAGKQAVKKLVGEKTYNEMFDIKKDQPNSASMISDLRNGKKKYSQLSDNEMSAILARMTKEEAIRNKLK